MSDQSTRRPSSDAPSAGGLSAPAVARSAGQCEAVNAFGIGVSFLLRAEETRGALSVYLLTVNPGDGSPPHVHRRDDEGFYVLSGEFEFRCGSQVVRHRAGSIVFLPRDVPHLFRNAGTTPGQLLAIGSPGGHERFFVDAAQLGHTPDAARAAEVCQRHGMEIVAMG